MKMRTMEVLVDGVHGKKIGGTFECDTKEAAQRVALGQAIDKGPAPEAEDVPAAVSEPRAGLGGPAIDPGMDSAGVPLDGSLLPVEGRATKGGKDKEPANR